MYLLFYSLVPFGLNRPPLEPEAKSAPHTDRARNAIFSHVEYAISASEELHLVQNYRLPMQGARRSSEKGSPYSSMIDMQH
jgi:hypothetical protein